MPNWYQDPPLLLAVLLLTVGLLLLNRGADLLVNGAIALARRFAVSPALVGVTVVAFGTSLPELVVSLGAHLKAIRAGLGAADGPGAIALANVIGSNIFNIGIILGLVVLIRPIAVPPATLRTDYPFLVLAVVLLVLASVPVGGADPAIMPWQGIIMLAVLVVFLIRAIRGGRMQVEGVAVVGTRKGMAYKAWFLVVLGLVLLSAGGELCLTGAIGVARGVGLGERVIGLTVLAFGTSLPELATSIQAARRGEAGVAIGNVIGSCLFNILGVVALLAIIAPLPVHQDNLAWDYWWMTAIVLLLLPLMWTGRILIRWEGVALLSVSAVYMLSLFL